jgi:hypothetical protein
MFDFVSMARRQAECTSRNFPAGKFVEALKFLSIRVFDTDAQTVAVRNAIHRAGIMGSNPTRGIDVCVRLFCVRALLCAGSGLATN